MRTRVVILWALAIVLAVGVGAAVARAGSLTYVYGATVRCSHPIQEDDASHLKLVEFDRDGRQVQLVYRCHPWEGR